MEMIFEPLRYLGPKDSEHKEDFRNDRKIKIEINEVLGLRPKVSLSGKRNLESVIKWMKEHMEAFEETRYGFLVDFIDDGWRNGYEVVPYSETELGDIEAKVVISGVTYEIVKHTFSKSEHEMYKKFEESGESKRKSTFEDLVKYLGNGESSSTKTKHLLGDSDKSITGGKKVDYEGKD